MAVQGQCALYLVEQCCEPIATIQALPVRGLSATDQSQHMSARVGVQCLSSGVYVGDAVDTGEVEQLIDPEIITSVENRSQYTLKPLRF